MKQLPKKGLVITRKRKKWKFAHFDEWQNCFELNRNSDPKKLKTQLSTRLSASRTDPDANRGGLVVELAAGNAQFSLELARRHPEMDFIAVDIKSDRLYTSAKKALEEEVNNIAFVRAHINEVEELFDENSVDEIWITFPDPHPKKRSAKHRLTHTHFLQLYRNILKRGGVLKFKTDNRDLFNWSLEQFVTDNCLPSELSFDL
ncbi:tRNA (guanosine(46)-N7)-methyltransferase TrmB, partial [Candidatus Saccharibacteria bacterium]|nr:tRNA (guanosine(46)-N7)-methyltransferase TrmB [Candidatus Saccharibacteria bacterium]